MGTVNHGTLGCDLTASKEGTLMLSAVHCGALQQRFRWSLLRVMKSPEQKSPFWMGNGSPHALCLAVFSVWLLVAVGCS